MLILYFLLIIIAILLFSILPRIHMRKRCQNFSHLCFAHRGLWDNEKQIPENSLPAFAEAVHRGFAIELDVHLTRDRRLVVFHDDTLLRMCGDNRHIWDCTYDELQSLHLADTDEVIPLLSEVLSLVDGKTTLLIELKANLHSTAICPAVMELLSDYQGAYCIESFSPFILRWFMKHQPQIIRGQLSCRFDSGVTHPRPLLFMSEHLLFNWVGRPDFIAYQFQRGRQLFTLKLLRLLGTPVFFWTIHSEKALKNSRTYCDSIIFDRFIPASISFNKKE